MKGEALTREFEVKCNGCNKIIITTRKNRKWCFTCRRKKVSEYRKKKK